MSAHHHSADNIQHLYEGDQSKLYSGVYNHHTDYNSAESKSHVKRIWMITLWLTIITIFEVAIGLAGHYYGFFSKVFLAIYFLALTILKAYLIVKVFMHLGDEKKTFVYLVIGPLGFLVWGIVAFVTDGSHWLEMNNTQAHTKEVKEVVIKK
jgi:cytochrome c oxidase subunit 4